MNNFFLLLVILLVLQGCNVNNYGPCARYKKMSLVTREQVDFFNNISNCRVSYDEAFSYSIIKSSNDKTICNFAVRDGKWSTKEKNSQYVIEAKKRKLPIVCSKQSVNCIYDEYKKIMNITNCDDCYASANCRMK